MGKFSIRKGDKRQPEGRIMDFQEAVNKQAKHRVLDLKIMVDGDPGNQTFRAATIIGKAMGVGRNNMKALKRGVVTESLRSLIQNERNRTKKEVKRSNRRKRWLKNERKRLKGGPNKAVQFLMSYAGKTEEPYGSNLGAWGLTAWQTALGSYLVGLAWCGTAVGTALMRAGVKGIDGSVASVASIEDHARAASASTSSGMGENHGGFVAWLAPGAGKRGDAVILFGRGVHVGIIRWRTPLGYFTIEGNTSSGSSGSQSNGGGVFPRFRTFGEVYGCARPDWP